MNALLLIVVFTWIASSFGQTLLQPMPMLQSRPLERFVYGGAIGLGTAAYGVLALGLCGLLSWGPIAVWWGVMGLIGLHGMRTQGHDLIVWMRRMRKRELQHSHESGVILVMRICSTVILTFVLVSLVACFRSPGALEWDALSYHLAAPKIFLQHHRIDILPTQHQSNFPFTVEMLYVVGLAFNGFALANMFHLVLAVLTALGIMMYGERHHGSGAGYLGSVIFVTTPLVLWEASVAYIDIGMALFTSLAAFSAVSALRSHRSERVMADKNAVNAVEEDVSNQEPEEPYSQTYVSDGAPSDHPNASAPIASAPMWIALAGCMMGFALGTKYLALIPLVLITLLLIWRRFPLRLVALFAVIALAVGSPWYIKNAVIMHNPVYPFAYRVFPQTRYWSRDREVAYSSEQQRFGYPHALSQPRESLINLIEVPWRTLIEVSRYFNQGEVTFSAMIGGLYAAFCFALLLQGRPRGELSELAWLAVAQLVAWFFVAQVGRYLIPLLPLFALLSGVAAASLLGLVHGRHNVWTRLLQAATVLLLTGQVVLVAVSITLFPTVGQTGLLPTALSLPEALQVELYPDEREHKLSQRLDVYDAEKWLNQNTSPSDGVILYGETRGFYLDRPYLWGNEQHSSYIPYHKLLDGKRLTAWMNDHGFRYALINLNWSTENKGHRPIQPEDAESLMFQWYEQKEAPPGSWYKPVGDAIRQGLWTVVNISHGNVILRIGTSEANRSGESGSAHKGSPN